MVCNDKNVTIRSILFALLVCCGAPANAEQTPGEAYVPVEDFNYLILTVEEDVVLDREGKYIGVPVARYIANSEINLFS